jgi:transposase
LTVFKVLKLTLKTIKMATRSAFKLSRSERQRRSFSEDFKRTKVREIEQKVSRICEIVNQYEVSKTAVRRWVMKYSTTYMKGVKTIVEAESDTKKLLELKAKIAELERAVGQKQLRIDFQQKMIELAEETYGVDIKKKFGDGPSSGFGKTEKS